MIDNDDLFKQEKIYTRNGSGMWAVLGYCPYPSVTMINLETDETVNFGLGGNINTEFIDSGDVKPPIYSGETVGEVGHGWGDGLTDGLTENTETA